MNYELGTRTTPKSSICTITGRPNAAWSLSSYSTYEANKLLDKVRESQPVPRYLIDLALELTGDL